MQNRRQAERLVKGPEIFVGIANMKDQRQAKLPSQLQLPGKKLALALPYIRILMIEIIKAAFADCHQTLHSERFTARQFGQSGKRFF